MSDRVTYNAYQSLALGDILTKHANVVRDVDLRDLTLDARDGLSFANAKFTGVSLASGDGGAKLDLTDVELRACDLGAVHLARSTWQTVNLHEVRGPGVRMNGSVLRGVRVNRSDLRTATFANDLFEDVVFERCDLSYTEWTRVTLFGCAKPFARTPLAHARFTACVFVGVDWSAQDDSDLIHFEECHFIGGAPLIPLPAGNLIVAAPETSVPTPPPEAARAAAPTPPRPSVVEPPAPAAAPSRFSSLELGSPPLTPESGR